MANCPTKAAHNVINKATTDVSKKRLFILYRYRQNTKLVGTIVLGQASDHRLVVMEKTKTTDGPTGFSWKAIDNMKKKSKPSNITTEIALNNDLDNI